MNPKKSGETLLGISLYPNTSLEAVESQHREALAQRIGDRHPKPCGLGRPYAAVCCGKISVAGRRGFSGMAKGTTIPLRKQLGQHHLMHPELCRPLLRFLRPRGHLVVEVGPGGGVLTRQLVEAGARVVAVEIDPCWAFAGAAALASTSAAMVVADALELAWNGLPAGSLVAGNLPFQISTVLIERILPHWRSIPRAAFLVQKEVAERLLARPGRPGYGALSVQTAARARVSLLGRVARGSFRPPPAVEGAFVGLELQAPVVSENEMPQLTATVRAAFAQRRKLVRNSLAAAWGRAEVDRVLAAAELDPRIRAEELTLGQFVTIHRLHTGPRPGRR